MSPSIYGVFVTLVNKFTVLELYYSSQPNVICVQEHKQVEFNG